MLARIEDARSPSWAVLAPTNPEPTYNGFLSWLVLLAEPNREIKSAQWLSRRNLWTYAPNYPRMIRTRGKAHRHRLYSCIPGYLFIPTVVLDTGHGWDYLHQAPGVRGWIKDCHGAPATISKAHVEVIREIEAKLNLPPEAKGVMFKMGEWVRVIKDDIFWQWTGPIVEIAREGRIGVEVNLLGRATVVYASASQIERM